MSLRVGYVVKRFPRASETFIAQEILGLERLGTDVRVLTLWPNDVPAGHAWLDEIRAPITHCGDLPLSNAWKWLHRRRAERGDDPSERAVLEAFRYPDRRGRHRLREAVAVAEAAERFDLHHLHAHFANDPTFVAYLAHLATGISFSFTAHAKDIYAKALPRELLRRVVGAAAFAVTVSEDNRQHLQRVLGPGRAAKVLALYNGVDLERIQRRRPTSSGRLRILCVARLVEKKGVDSLLRALAVLSRRDVGFEATVIGDGPYREALEDLASKEGLEGRIRFVGQATHESVVAALGDHDVFVLPARVARDGDRDALPTVLLEAMAAGLPCVSTPVGGIPEIIVHRETGVLVTDPSGLRLAEALAELAAHPELRSRMGEAARSRAERLFDQRTNVARLRRWIAAASQGAPPGRKLPALRVGGR